MSISDLMSIIDLNKVDNGILLFTSDENEYYVDTTRETEMRWMLSDYGWQPITNMFISKSDYGTSLVIYLKLFSAKQ